MSSPAYPELGVDPDAFCTPDFFDLHSIPFMKRGWLITDYPDKTAPGGRNWKDRVASLTETRFKNGKLTDRERRSIFAWLERNRQDYPMLPPGQDPRFASNACQWTHEWGWPRNACSSLTKEVEAVISPKERDPLWDENPKWRQLHAATVIRDCVPELDEDQRTWSVRREAGSLASLVAHPLRFGDILKMIDPYADYDRWHPTLDAMLQHANPGIVIELHCSRKKAAGEKGRGPSTRGPSESFRKAWENWASKEPSGNLRAFSVYFWQDIEEAEGKFVRTSETAELHDRHVIIGATTSNEYQPFAGVSVGKGWDQARPSERKLETSFTLMTRKDQKIHWEHYSKDSTVFTRVESEDVRWNKSE